MQKSKTMKQAILITAYKDLQSLQRLVSCFDNDFEFYIHIDKNCKEDIPCFNGKNVHIIRRYHIQWGSERHLWAMIELFKKACQDGPYAYYHTITASDYPIRPVRDFKSFFTETNDKIYLDFHQLPWEKWTAEGGWERVKYYWVGNQWLDSRLKKMFFMKKLLKIQRKTRFSRDLTHYSQWYGGLSYFSIPHDAAMVVASLSWKEIKKTTRFTHAAEEIYLQTVLVNRFFSERLVNNPLRYTVWCDSSCSPKVLMDGDYEKMIGSGAFFARKMDKVASGQLMEKIDKDCQFHTQGLSND